MAALRRPRELQLVHPALDELRDEEFVVHVLLVPGRRHSWAGWSSSD
ncbi:hypothetical protein [Halorussus caseinilyticus]|uniref:Uncharacterized protein n=1 Tax=Halorussus caseinilyticus TaxID=3034025 RepID=A0ABD5WVT4_9EURY